MSWIRIWIHFVWSTKNRVPFLNDEIRPQLFDHIKTNAREKDIFIDSLNGYTDHAHCLISLSADQTIEKLMQLIKGESSFWLNRSGLCNQKFGWQNKYFAASVSHSQIEKVRKYIANQDKQHRLRTFDDEFEDFLLRSGFSKFNDG
jgi:putative transposase